jgi:glutathione S-transferase
VRPGHITDVFLTLARLSVDVMANLELYELEGCPYCAKVIKKLDELGLDYESHMVERDHDKRDEVEAVSGQTGVPVLVDKDNGIDAMPESDDIVEYLEETYGSGAT